MPRSTKARSTRAATMLSSAACLMAAAGAAAADCNQDPPITIDTVVASGPGEGFDFASLSIVADPSGSATGAADEAPPVNYRGETVAAAPTRYMEDFEDGMLGDEWLGRSPILNHEKLSQIAVVPRGEDGLTVHLSTSAKHSYMARLDLIILPPTPEDMPGTNGEPENVVTVSVDGAALLTISPEELRSMRGADAERGQPLLRTVRIPFISAHPISTVTITASEEREGERWSDWAIDNVMVDAGTLDPVFGVSGGEDGFEPGLLGIVDPRAGLAGELPGSRFATNDADFTGTNGGGGGAPPQSREVPAPGVLALATVSSFLLVRRRR